MDRMSVGEQAVGTEARKAWSSWRGAVRWQMRDCGDSSRSKGCEWRGRLTPRIVVRPHRRFWSFLWSEMRSTAKAPGDRGLTDESGASLMAQTVRILFAMHETQETQA